MRLEKRLKKHAKMTTAPRGMSTIASTVPTELLPPMQQRISAKEADDRDRSMLHVVITSNLRHLLIRKVALLFIQNQ
jgi:hypothetical protein